MISSHDGHSWSGRTVLVTGAAGELGKATVDALVQRGARVHAADRDEATLTVLARRHGERVVPHLADLSVQSSIEQLALDLSHQESSIDALIHCVGHNTYPSSSQPIPADEWQGVLADNLIAPALMSQSLLPLLGRVPASGVVMVTSINGRISSPWPHYAAAKAGLSKLTRDLAFQFAPHGVRVNAVAPGWFVGPDTHDGPTPDRSATLTAVASPVAAIVHAVLFLADPALSPCTTGQELAVDAGTELNA